MNGVDLFELGITNEVSDIIERDKLFTTLEALNLRDWYEIESYIRLRYKELDLLPDVLEDGLGDMFHYLAKAGFETHFKSEEISLWMSFETYFNHKKLFFSFYADNFIFNNPEGLIKRINMEYKEVRKCLEM